MRLNLSWCLVLLPIVAGSQSAHAEDAAVELLGKGVQIYACAAVGNGFAWRLKGPDASLAEASGREVGRHFAGPSWRAADGSVVVGEAIAASPSPTANAVPWLVLRAKSHDGNGRFASVAYITRTRTTGGVAPQSGCDATHVGSETRVPYAATYTFFPGPASTP
jgi:hypothetical protein